MNKTDFKILFFIAFLFFNLTQSPAQSIDGYVKDSTTNSAIVNAIIVSEPKGQFTYSDQNGYFELKDLPAEKINLKISHMGFEIFQKSVDLSDKDHLSLSINVKPTPIALEEILISGSIYNNSLASEILQEEFQKHVPKDAGEIFKYEPGFNVIKRGGYAMDPVFRSFKYEQLNLQFDNGIRIAHACPNRMDPITTHIPPEALEKIEIIKGPYSVRFGQSMGGIVNMVIKKPVHTDEFNVSGSFNGGYESNGNGRQGRLSLTATDKIYDLTVMGGYKNYDNYKNGNGYEVASSFRNYDFSVKGGIEPFENHRLQLMWRQNFARDVLHAGLPMDADEDDAKIFSADYLIRNVSPKIKNISAKFYATEVDHVMTNHRRPNFKMVDAVSKVLSETMGGRIEFELLPVEGVILYAGGDFNSVFRDGQRVRKISINPCNTEMTFDPPKEFTDPIWQSSYLNDFGLFAEWRQSLMERFSFIAGFRSDIIRSGVDNPASEFTSRYNFDQNTETNWSFTASGAYDISNGWQLKLSAGRGVRSPNLIERYINHLTIGQDAYEYIGNPNLKPEKNNQAELSIAKRSKSYHIKADIFYSYATDYITAAVDENTDRLFLPCKPPQHVKVFTNIDQAIQRGFEMAGSVDLHPRIKMDGNLAYTWAQNISWDEPLPETPPLEGNLALNYQTKNKNFWTEISGRFVADQNRASDSFAETATEGFNVYNFYSGYKPQQWMEIQFSVHNIFDKTYYEHLNRRYKNMPVNEVFFEPGRSFLLQAKINF